jgi:hypothetical protein
LKGVLHGALLIVVGSAAIAAAQPAKPNSSIFSCTTPDGRKLKSDRPIAECIAIEQKVLNSDGSLRAMYPPSLTAEERAEKEAKERKAKAEQLAQQDAARRDRNLVARFPDEAAHGKAREAALDTVRLAMKASQQRLSDLAGERKPLEDEVEFYKGQRLPAKLKQQLDANDAATEAQEASIQNQEAELARINKLYDVELERLRKLWAGAVPGSLGPAPVSSSSASAALSRASSSKAH